MTQDILPPARPDRGERPSILTSLAKLEEGTDIVYTRRGLETQYRGQLVGVLSDGFIVSINNRRRLLVFIHAIDTIEPV